MGYGNIVGSADGKYPTEACAARQLEIPATTESLGYAVNDLGEALGMLASRLSPVLGAPVPTSDGLEKSQGYGCEVATNIAANTHRIRSITDAARTLLGRLEV